MGSKARDVPNPTLGRGDLMLRRLVVMTRLLLIAVLGSSIALGQQPQGFTVSGHIRQPNGNPAGNVRVFLTRQPQGTIYTGQTNDDGAFRFDRVSPGQYDLFAGALESTTLAGT